MVRYFDNSGYFAIWRGYFAASAKTALTLILTQTQTLTQTLSLILTLIPTLNLTLTQTEEKHYFASKRLNTGSHFLTLKLNLKKKLFNRLRGIWPKGYQCRSLGKSHWNGDYLKTSNAKKLSSRRNRTCSLWITGPLLYHLS